jgi:hypothetical protein
MAILLSDARTALLNRKRDLSDVSTAVFSQWCDFINKSLYRKLISTDVERFVSTASFTVSSAPQTSSLPADFRDIQPLGTGFFVLDSNGNATPRTLARTGFGSSVPGYYITGSSVVFTGMDSESITLRYIPTQSTITALTDYFTVDTLTGGTVIVPEEYMLFLVEALDVLYSRWDDEPGEESFADARFVRALNELVETLRREPDVYAIDNFVNNY